MLVSVRFVFLNMIVDSIAPELGYSTPGPDFTLEERRHIGANIEDILKGEKEAAHAPPDIAD